MNGTIVAVPAEHLGTRCQQGCGGECRTKATIVVGQGWSPLYLCDTHGVRAIKEWIGEVERELQEAKRVLGERSGKAK